MSSPESSDTAIPSPTAMVVLASEQLWPNIHGLAHWGDSLRHLCIYQTTDKDRSCEPADRLASFATSRWPSLKLHRSEPGNFMPQDVHRQLRSWQTALPGEQWLINATGGSKLMFAGALGSVGARGSRVVYRELAGEWFELLPDLDGPGIRTIRLAVPAAATDRLGATELVRAFWATSTRRVEIGAEPAQAPVRELIRAWIASRGNWVEAYNRCGLPPARGQNLFEQFVASAVRGLGVRNLASNVVRVDRQSGQHLQEIDLIVNDRGRLSIIDCKLATSANGYRDRQVEPITAQIRQAAQTRRELGLGARYLLLRPSTVFQDAERDLAETSRLSVMDQEDCRALFSGLRHFLGVPGELPDSLRRAEAELAQAAEWPWTNPLRPARQDVEEVVVNSNSRRGIVDLDAYMRAHGQPWVAYRLSPDVDFQLTRPESVREDRALLRLIEDRFREFGQVHSFTVSNNGNTAWFRIALIRGAYDRFVAYLEPFVGRSLFAAGVSAARR